MCVFTCTNPARPEGSVARLDQPCAGEERHLARSCCGALMHSRISASHAREREEERNRGKRDTGRSQLGQTVTHSQPANSTAALEKKFLIVFHSHTLPACLRCSLALGGKSVFLDLSFFFFFFSPAVFLPFPSAPCGNQLNEPFDSELQAGG